MHRWKTSACCVVLMMAAGCASGVAGTWKMAPDQPAGAMTFGSMTLAEDGTFTAEAKYGNETRVMSGQYEFTGDRLTFDSNGEHRVYDADLSSNKSMLTVTHNDKAVKMVRLKPH